MKHESFVGRSNSSVLGFDTFNTQNSRAFNTCSGKDPVHTSNLPKTSARSQQSELKEAAQLYVPSRRRASNRHSRFPTCSRMAPPLPHHPTTNSPTALLLSSHRTRRAAASVHTGSSAVRAAGPEKMPPGS